MSRKDTQQDMRGPRAKRPRGAVAREPARGCGAALRPLLQRESAVQGGSLVQAVTGLVRSGVESYLYGATEKSLPVLTAKDFSFRLQQDLPACLRHPHGKLLFAGCRPQRWTERIMGGAPRVWALVAPPLGQTSCRVVASLAGTSSGKLTLYVMRVPARTNLEDYVFQKIREKLVDGYVESGDCALALQRLLRAAVYSA